VTALLPLAVLLPLLLTLLATLGARARVLQALLSVIAVPALVLAAWPGAPPSTAMPWLLLGAVWELDALRRVFLLLTAALWVLAGTYAAAYLSLQRLRSFALFWGLTCAGNLVLVVAADVASFYSAFAVMSFAAYGLVLHEGGAVVQRAGRVYIAFAVLGEALLLAGLLLATQRSESLLLVDVPAGVLASIQPDLVIALLWLGFGVKAGVPLLHVWLPLAHPVAPTPASAVLSGAMVKAGVLGWLLTLPFGQPAVQHWGLVIATAGAAGALLALLPGVCQRDPKAVLAYSSVSQLGLMAMLVGFALLSAPLSQSLIAVVALYALHHAFAKGALFLACGLAPPARGAGRWALLVVIVLPVLALVGAPLSSGVVVKLQSKVLLAEFGPDAAPLLDALIVAFAGAAVATALLMLRFAWLYLRLAAKPLAWRPVAITLACAASVYLALPWAAATLVLDGHLRWWPGAAASLGALWPMALAGVVAALVLQRRVVAPALPAGDVLSVYRIVWRLVAHGWRRSL